ncbi:MAG TPA: phosphoenolpyruvate carboxykinase (ATP), partial [Vicinamibacterales bacterium]
MKDQKGARGGAATAERARTLEAHGINAGTVHWNLTIPELVEAAVRRGEGVLAADGPIVCSTGQHTGRSPNDKFVVREPSSEQHVAWGKVNRAIDEAAFDRLHDRMLKYLEGRDLYALDCHAGADPAYRLNVRVINELAWHNLFARHMFIPVTDPAEQAAHEPDFTVIDIPSFTADPAVDGTNSEVFILLNFAKKVVLIGGTSYAGEMKKSIFTVMNYLLPLRDTMPMHCSANIGKAGDTALFFGLSGTGKTTLSSDHDRGLIGDDEHGWSDRGVFNFEGGCYAKMIRLSAEAEPQI